MRSPENYGKARRPIAVKATAILGATMLFGAMTATSAGAQDAAQTCNGLEATIVVAELGDGTIGTNGDDVMVVVTTYGDVDFRNGDVGSTLPPVVLGLGGNDTICVLGNGSVDVRAGSGDDTLLLGSHDLKPNDDPFDVYAQSTVFAGSGDDEIVVLSGSHQIFAGLGNDTVTVEIPAIEHLYPHVYVDGEAGNDTLTGGPSYDALSGGPGNDIIRGGGEADWIDGGDDDDILYGGWGHDEIDGGDGDDTLYGSRGHDNLRGGDGADTLYGGPGNDTIHSSRNFSMNPHAPSDELVSAGSRMFGGSGDDTLWGSNRWDRMQGGPGDDLLAGFEGRDYLRGGPGNDQIIGGANIDDVNGNTGADRIFFDADDNASGGYGNDECGGLENAPLIIPENCETEFRTTMAMINMNMMTGGAD